jgi:threonine dehydratase
MLLTLEDIKKAYSRIKPFINKTPVLGSSYLNSLSGAELYFKCENFQKVGAFKFRGATNAVLSLSKDELIKGVATHSSGNHAAALALAAKNAGINAFIVMPDNALKIKKNAVKDYGGIITFCEPTLEARESTLEKIVEQTGANFIHPYDNEKIIVGQGTACLELLDELKDIDTIIAPVGGGGLLSGTSISAKGINKNIRVIAAEPKNADDAFRSFYSGKFIPSENPNTLADGLLTSLSDLTFSIIKQNVDQIITVSEIEIIDAMRLVWERMKIIIEPSSATVLAVVLANKEKFKNKKIGLIISGGNVDLEKLPF